MDNTLADGRYELLHKLGEGGMATVWRAHDHRLGVERAVKILIAGHERSTALTERSRREARLMAQLEHPNIVQVHDVGEHEGRTWVVMSLVERGSLADHVKRFGPMPPRLASRVIEGVLQALVAAHELGVIHRDIKPHNVLVDRLGNVRLADFGIAMASGEDPLTRTGALMGTWAYMPPEQRSSAKSVEPRSDLYAVGAMLLNLLRDIEPHDLHNAEAHEEQLEGVPDALAAFIIRCTRYQPAERFGSAASALTALRALDLPADPEGTPSLGTGWVAPGEYPPTEPRQTQETLLAYGTDPVPTGVTLGVDPDQPDDDGPVVDPEAPTALGAPTIVLGIDEEPPLFRGPPPRMPVGPLVAVLAVLLLAGPLVVVGGLGLVGQTLDTPPAPLPEPALTVPEPSVVEPVPTPVFAPSPAPTPAPAVPDPAPVVPPVEVEAPAPPPPEPPPEPVEPQVVAPVEAVETGQVMVFSLPASEVFIDGASHGSGRVRADLPYGAHRVRLVPGEGRPVERVLTVDGAGPVRFCWDFQEDAVCSR